MTPTCASNLLGYVPPSAFARGNADAARAAFALLAHELGGDAESHARRCSSSPPQRCAPTIDALIADYELERANVVLVGGGGGSGGARAVRCGARWVRASDRARCGGDLADRRRARARARRGRAHDRRSARRKISCAFGARRPIGSSPRARRPIASRCRSRSTRSTIACARSPPGRPRWSMPRRRLALRVEHSDGKVRVIDERDVVRLVLKNASAQTTTVGALDDALARAIENRYALRRRGPRASGAVFGASGPHCGFARHGKRRAGARDRAGGDCRLRRRRGSRDDHRPSCGEAGARH